MHEGGATWGRCQLMSFSPFFAEPWWTRLSPRVGHQLADVLRPGRSHNGCHIGRRHGLGEVHIGWLSILQTVNVNVKIFLLEVCQNYFAGCLSKSFCRRFVKIFVSQDPWSGSQQREIILAAKIVLSIDAKMQKCKKVVSNLETCFCVSFPLHDDS